MITIPAEKKKKGGKFNKQKTKKEVQHITRLTIHSHNNSFALYCAIYIYDSTIARSF